ncbi:hypothetical protein QZH41_018135, partial [Actinostola sp. cb2023]
IGSLNGIFHFRHKTHPVRSKRSLEQETSLLYDETSVKWAKQQIIKRRVKREYDPKLNDPLFHAQWYLDRKASFDFNSNDPDPTPRRTWNNENRHGTRCAGEVAAVFNNSICIAGVAPKARIGGVRMLDGEVTDAVEASSLSLQPQYIEIYSASWGPDDDGKTVDGPGPLAKHAFNNGITQLGYRTWRVPVVL